MPRETRVELLDLRARHHDRRLRGLDLLIAARQARDLDLALRLGERGLVAVARHHRLIERRFRRIAMRIENALALIFGGRERGGGVGGLDGGLQHGDLLRAVHGCAQIVELRLHLRQPRGGLGALAVEHGRGHGEQRLAFAHRSAGLDVEAGEPFALDRADVEKLALDIAEEGAGASAVAAHPPEAERDGDQQDEQEPASHFRPRNGGRSGPAGPRRSIRTSPGSGC